VVSAHACVTWLCELRGLALGLLPIAIGPAAWWLGLGLLMLALAAEAGEVRR